MDVYKKLKHGLEKIRYIWFRFQYGCICVAKPFLFRNSAFRSLWIISERGVDAKDNAFWLYQYIIKEHPEINIRYIISRKSEDRKKVEALGRKVIYYRSFLHMAVFLLSKVKISTHIMGYSPDMFFFHEWNKKQSFPGIKVFLQHGITKDDIPYLYAKNTSLNLFVCGAQKEFAYIQEHYGYQSDQVKMLGFCRFDMLPLKSRRNDNGIILLMPTWRTYLKDSSALTFLKSKFYQNFNNLLTNTALVNFLNKNHLQLLVYPHHEMTHYVKYFDKKSENIHIMSGKENIQQLLIEADVLITDYSSVFFDFGYMEKPVIYYQFDRLEYFQKHYRPGYFDYRVDGFGPVLESEEEVIKNLQRIMEKGFEMDVKYKTRVESFFKIRDQNNCKRNFDAIWSLFNEGESCE